MRTQNSRLRAWAREGTPGPPAPPSFTGPTKPAPQDMTAMPTLNRHQGDQIPNGQSRLKGLPVVISTGGSGLGLGHCNRLGQGRSGSGGSGRGACEFARRGGLDALHTGIDLGLDFLRRLGTGGGHAFRALAHIGDQAGLVGLHVMQGLQHHGAFVLTIHVNLHRQVAISDFLGDIDSMPH